jgi:hypothetical protein
LSRIRVWPADFQDGFLANEKFRTAVDANVEGVRTIRDNLREAFFLQVQALVGAVQDDAQRMGAGGEGAIEMERFTQIGGVEPSRDQNILAGIDSEGFLRDGGDDLDAKRSELLGTRGLRVGGWGGGGRLSKRRVERRPRVQSRSLPPSRG